MPKLSTNRKKVVSGLVVLVSSGSADEAAKIAKVIVEAKLAACANIVPSIRSIFRWKGRIEDCSEALIIFKTTSLCYKRLEEKVRENHTYTVPEIIGLTVSCGSPQYLDWVREQTSK